MNNLEILFNHTDAQGNTLRVAGGELLLKLATEARERNIGRVAPHPADGQLVYIKQDTEAQVFRKTDAWSLMYDVVKNVKYIAVMTERGVYKTTSANVLKYGSFLHFKTAGMERKLYVPRRYFYFTTVLTFKLFNQ